MDVVDVVVVVFRGVEAAVVGGRGEEEEEEGRDEGEEGERASLKRKYLRKAPRRRRMESWPRRKPWLKERLCGGKGVWVSLGGVERGWVGGLERGGWEERDLQGGEWWWRGYSVRHVGRLMMLGGGALRWCAVMVILVEWATVVGARSMTF